METQPKFPVPATILEVGSKTPISPEAALKLLESSGCKEISKVTKRIKASGTKVTLEIL